MVYAEYYSTVMVAIRHCRCYNGVMLSATAYRALRYAADIAFLFATCLAIVSPTPSLIVADEHTSVHFIRRQHHYAAVTPGRASRRAHVATLFCLRARLHCLYAQT